LTIAFILPFSVYPTKLSGEINLTKGNSQLRAAQKAIDVFPVPPSNYSIKKYFLLAIVSNEVARKFLFEFISQNP